MKSGFIKTVVLIFAIGFMLSGILGFLGSITQNNLLKVDGKRVHINKFLQFLNNKRRGLYSKNLSEEQLAYLNSKKFIFSTLQEFIDSYLLDESIRNLHLLEPEKSVLNEIYQSEYFKNKDENFDVNKYKSFLKQINFTEEEYIKFSAEYNTKINFAKVLSIPNNLNDKFLDMLEKSENTYIIADILYIDPKTDLNFKQNKITDKTVQDYYNNNKDNFIEPEKKVFSYIELNFNNYKNDILQKKIEELEENILSSDNMDILSKIYKVKKNSITYSVGDQKPKDLKDEVLQYDEGTFSDIIYLPNNTFKVYFVENVINQRLMQLNEVKDKIKKIIFTEEKDKHNKILLDKLTNQLNKNNIVGVAQKNNIKLKQDILIYKDADTFPIELNKELFHNKKQGYVSNYFFDPINNQYLIVKIKNLKLLSQDNKKYATKENIKNTYINSYQMSIFDLYKKYLTSTKKVIINQNLLNNILPKKDK